MLKRDEMDAERQRVYDKIEAATGRVGRGPSIGFAYSPGLWESHNASSAHNEDCSLTPVQVRIVTLLTVRHWNSAYPWIVKAASALRAGVEPSVIEAINAGVQPDFSDSADESVHAVAGELLKTGTLGDDIFKAAESKLGYRRLADVVGVIGHFSATALMANVAGAVPAADAPSQIKA